MDSLIAAAGRALTAGDVLGALKHVGWREDPAALALRGIAMAQLGDYPRARELLKRAAHILRRQQALSDQIHRTARNPFPFRAAVLGPPQYVDGCVILPFRACQPLVRRE